MDKHLRNFAIGMTLYGVVLFASIGAILRFDFGRPVAIIIALTPVIPLMFGMLSIVARLRLEDELQRQIHLESVVVTALVVGGVTFSWGLLEAASLVPHMPNLLVFPGMIAVWGITKPLVSRRYS